MPKDISLSSVLIADNGEPDGKQPTTCTSVRELIVLAARGLDGMFDSQKQLFCFSLRPSERGWVREGLSTRYSIISLLGLHRLERAGMVSPVPIRNVLAALVRDKRRITDLGDLGLTLWLCALASPEHLERVYFSFGAERALSDSQSASQRRTMELAWFLTGLAYAGSLGLQTLPGLPDLAVKTYQLLVANQGGSGAFGHLARSMTLARFLRGQIGSFADQVYPIYALSKFAQIFQIPGALIAAQRCADAICRAQGSLGQWWWHYHSKTGEVLEYYPVYAVHQHGMAPMALFALNEAAHVDFSEAIAKGLRWISGDNEVGIDLRVGSAGIIWRSLYHRNLPRKYFRNAMSFAGFSGRERADDLKVKAECRPYELGWLLYAFAGRGAD